MILATDTAADRRAQWYAVGASFFGWTFDAFDFFVLTFMLTDVAKAFGETRPTLTWTLTATLAMRPVGAFVFGIMADRVGRRLSMTVNIVFYSIMSALSGLAPSFGWFLVLRALFGIDMGGQWGIGASLVLETVPARWRGVLSGLLHQGYSLGTLAALAEGLLEQRVMLIEQPLPRGHEAHLEGFDSPIPIAADESVLSLAELPRAAGRFNVVNIKLDKCGGLTEGLMIADEARKLGLEVMVGTMIGTSLATAPAFILAQQCAIVDLDGPTFLVKDRSPAVIYRDGTLFSGDTVWGGPGAFAA